jgi:hypothetical protein
MKSGSYSVGTDGSNDEAGLKKLNPILIRLFDNTNGRVSLQLLDMGANKESTAEALFNNIDKILEVNPGNVVLLLVWTIWQLTWGREILSRQGF